MEEKDGFGSCFFFIKSVSNLTIGKKMVFKDETVFLIFKPGLKKTKKPGT